MDFSKLAFVDVETTGGSSAMDRIIEVAVLRIEDGRLVKTFSSLVDPECQISSWITSITGIRQSDVNGAPTFHQIADELCEAIKDCTFVAHNVRFDYGFIKSELERANKEFNPPHFCTVKLSRVLYPTHKRHNLDSIIDRHKIDCPNRHRALDDARVLWEFYQQVQKKFPAKKISKALELISSRSSWPSNVPRQEIERLPATPGVYIFYGDNDLPIYVGKSVNIKSRVISHFNDDLRSTKEMKLSQQIKRIDTIQTAGELGALLKESALIKEMMPIYNRQLRKSDYLTMVKTYLDDKGYLCTTIENTDQSKIMPDDLPHIAGIFRSKRQAENELAKMALEHRLCKKLLNLEKTKKGCFGRQLKKCDGACIQDESAVLYNLRFEMAFVKLRFKKWPYETPIVISESLGGEVQSYLVDKWCYLGKVDSDAQQIQQDIKFDLDIYKILRNFLRNPQSRAKIQIAPNYA